MDLGSHDATLATQLAGEEDRFASPQIPATASGDVVRDFDLTAGGFDFIALTRAGSGKGNHQASGRLAFETLVALGIGDEDAAQKQAV